MSFLFCSKIDVRSHRITVKEKCYKFFFLEYDIFDQLRVFMHIKMNLMLSYKFNYTNKVFYEIVFDLLCQPKRILTESSLLFWTTVLTLERKQEDCPSILSSFWRKLSMTARFYSAKFCFIVFFVRKREVELVISLIYHSFSSIEKYLIR